MRLNQLTPSFSKAMFFLLFQKYCWKQVLEKKQFCCLKMTHRNVWFVSSGTESSCKLAAVRLTLKSYSWTSSQQILRSKWGTVYQNQILSSSTLTSVGMNENWGSKEQTSGNFNGEVWNLDGEIVFSFSPIRAEKNSYAWKVVWLNHNEIHELHILFVAHSRSWLNLNGKTQKRRGSFTNGKALKSLVLFFSSTKMKFFQAEHNCRHEWKMKL